MNIYANYLQKGLFIRHNVSDIGSNALQLLVENRSFLCKDKGQKRRLQVDVHELSSWVNVKVMVLVFELQCAGLSDTYILCWGGGISERIRL